MALHHVSAKSSGAGTSARPIGSLYAGAAVRGILRECGVVNTTATAVELMLAKLTAAGTPGAGLTETPSVPTALGGPAPTMTAFQTHSSDATVGDELRRVTLGAAIGSGYVWTFDGDKGIWIPAGTSNGVGILPVGTGQICTFWFVWEE